MDPLDLDGLGQAELVKAGQISAEELVQAAIVRIEARNPRINAIAAHDFERALERARGVKREDARPFAGVPFLFKDVVPYPGLPFSLGCRMLAANLTQESTPFSEAVDRAGFITLGKTTTSEFGLLGSTECLAHGATRNPCDPSRSATGSSGGSAAAVASGMVPLAHASDGGGSTRIPASACGLFGLKLSVGRTVAAINQASDYTRLISDHCITRSVRDSARFLSLVEAKDGPLPAVGYVTQPLTRRLKIGYYWRTLIGDEPDPEVKAALEHAVRLCEELGHEVIPAPLPFTRGAEISEGFFTIAASAMADFASMMTPMLGRPPGEEHLEPFTLSLIEWFRSQPRDAVQQAHQNFKIIRDETERYLSGYDVVLCPTLGMTPPPLGFLSPNLDRKLLIRRTERLAGYTPLHNIAGVPGMSVPLYRTAEGLPIGSHFAASLGGEATLLGLAYQLEKTSQW